MNGQALRKKTSGNASLRGRSAARSVLLEMARDEARAERIRSVIEQRKAEDPTFTTAWIAGHLHVDPRSVGYWKSTGSVSRENSDALAKLANADATWLWHGRKSETPDVLDLLPGTGPSHQVENMADEFRGHVRELHDRLTTIEQKQDRNLNIVTRLLEAMGGMTSEAVAKAVEQAAGTASQGGQSERDDTASSSPSTRR